MRSSLFVLGAALLVLVNSILEGNGYRWGAVTLLVAAFFAAPVRSLPANMLSLAMGLYCSWLFANAAFLTSAYAADSVYRPLILFGGFAATAVLGRDAQRELFRAGAALFAVLALIGVLQVFFDFWHLPHNPQRAAATFITPNTFATAINLFLLPLAAFAVTKRGGWQAYALALWLFAGLLATESRGGYLGFFAGAGFIALYAGIPRSREACKPWLRMLGGLLAVLLVFSLSVSLKGAGSGTETFGSTLISRGTSLRAELYSNAVNHILERPIAGFGANMFRPLYEMSKSADADSRITYHFVHNDYLQIWLEFGLGGIVLLGAIIFASFALIRQARKTRSDDPHVLACGAALTSCFVHALVDFPLYVPFLVMVIGCYLGTLAACGGADGRLAPIFSRAGEYLRPLASRLISGTLVVAGLAWLSQPVLADFAERKAVAELTAGRPAAGLYWQSVARRLEPRDATRYWAEGVIWRDQAIEAGNRVFAARADSLFADAIQANPNEGFYHLERARLHRRHADLLDNAARPAQILVWTGNAVTLRPYSMPAQIEHVQALVYAGRVEEARRLVGSLLERHPESDTVRRLASEMKLRAPLTGKGAP